ncbi:MAG TPA: tetratricopeptide repeat protein [Gemmatimonadaceae bacterium]|nr:tetratricopeptide repeat protein [Gemmatimonadaceae bacterium]
MRKLAVIGLALVLVASPALAQRGRAERIPPRPALPAGADTNDAMAYYQYGLSRIQRQPTEAANSFYWATRLMPVWADPYYARRTALHLEARQMLWRYVTRQRGIMNSREVRAIDSLATEALIRSPFYASRFDRMLLDEAVRFESGGEAWISRQRSGDPAFDAWMAFGDARFELAARLYGEALKRRPREYFYRAPRARAFYHLMQFDSAANELTLLLEEMRKRDETTLVYRYDSKAMFEYSLGYLYYLMDRYDDARAAYGRALEEDLSFHMAHVEMAQIALHQRDTATALSSLALAVELRESDAGVRIRYGDALAAAGRFDEAVAQYRAGIEHEPYFAQLYFNLARSLDRSGGASDAVVQYRSYLERAPRNRDEIALARQRISELAGGGGGTPR